MKTEVVLRDVTEADLPIFFEHESDRAACQMAAVPAKSREAFMARWREKVLLDPTTTAKTILFHGRVAGSIECWNQSGEQTIGYWIGREYWNKGIATGALSDFLRILKTRPLHARVAKHNLASLRVLQKCGFTISGDAEGPSHTPGETVEDHLLTLRGGTVRST
jgi:RimJ/RimL family protein N-acetyltransferase